MKRSLIVSALVFGLSGSAIAKPPTPRERADNRQDVREDHRELGNDRWDAHRLEKLLQDYRAALSKAPPAVIKNLDDRFQAELAIELRESRIEVGEKQQEVNEARREKNEERREVVKDVVKGKPVKTVRDAKDLADDKRDLADDRRDRGIEVANLEAKRSIRNRFQPLASRTDVASMNQKIGLIEEALGLAQREVNKDVREIREDRREKREDRRDTRQPD